MAKYSSKNNVVFRSAKERSFAKRKATNGGIILEQVPSTARLFAEIRVLHPLVVQQ